MTKKQLHENTERVFAQTAQALQTVYEALNKGQQKKLLANEEVAALFVRYGVEVGA